MRTILLHSILTGCTSSLTVGDRSNFFTRAFDSFITPFPVEVPQVPTCTLDDQFIDGIRARSCNDFGFKLGNSITDEKKPTLSSSAGDENRFISGPTNHGISAASTFPSPYLLASGDIVNLPQLGGVALSTAFGIFIACAHSLLNLLSSSGDANSGVTRNVEVPASGTKSDDETEILSTEAGGWMDQDQQDSPCPVEIYEHRILALCDIGIQSIGYSELDDMFILRNPTLFLGGCTSLSFVPHFCCDPKTTVPDMNIYAYCWPYPIDYDISALPQRALSTFAWWEFFNPR